MTQASTQTKLVRYSYGELPVLERLELEYALEVDSLLREEYEELRSAKRDLPKVTFAPTRTSLDVILAYSRNVDATTH